MQASAEKIWTTAQEHLRSMLSPDTYNLWFAPLRPCALDGGSIILHTTSVLRLSRYLGSMALSRLAWAEILDGTQGLPTSLGHFETAARRDGAYDNFYQLRFC